MVEDQPSEFKYEISGNNVVLVVRLSGDMNSKAVPAIERCRDEILSQPKAKFVIFNFAGVDQFGGDAIQTWAQVQKDIRSKPAELRLCEITDEQSEKLSRLGIVRASEIANTVRDAISSMSMARTQVIPPKKNTNV